MTVSIRGACSLCAISTTTLEAGIARILTDRLDWVTSVIGQVAEYDLDEFISLGRGAYVPRFDYSLL